MDKKLVKSVIDKIDVPTDEVFDAIHKGMKKADEKPQPFSRRRKMLFGSIAAASLVGITFGSGFVSPKMNQVLAEAPFIGDLYREFGDSMGYSLAKQSLVTELNQSVTKNGVTVKLTSAYFDGNIVSVTGHVSGDVNWKMNGEDEVNFDKNFEHNKGDNDPWLSGSEEVRKTGNGYDFKWTMLYPYETIKEDFTLPVTIHSINGSKGDWNFDIPIKQKKYSTLAINQSKSYPADGIELKFKELITAQASSSVVYEVVSDYEQDHIHIGKAKDSNGRILYLDNATNYAEAKETDGYHVTSRRMIDKIDNDVTSIIFYPSVSIMDSTEEQLLDVSSFDLKSKRTNHGIKVNKIIQKGNKLILDYQLQGLSAKMSKHSFDIMNDNLSGAFTLIDKNYLDLINEENPFPPENHGITSNKVTLLDKKTFHFQSEFNLNGEEKIEDFRLEETMLRFDFNHLNVVVKDLEPVTIHLPKRDNK
ncbi:DUF4179 domain-containing protein [Bacillus sp. V59.32b]|uniref:DUF4179 domain-containing protein n=1 Tax=Bacillus sp. V59.32b TaxID=1758642 RepID=UPI000E3BE77A|nr:DUF4179 domain-containing protein [Bacillus sp. V59.32b]RFU67149.1 DUF4179 domain-containing protein [Bacillus sp. V59.32b]